MARVSFGAQSSQSETKPVLDVAAEVQAEPASEKSETAIATRTANTAVDVFGGDDSIDFRDIQLPRLNIVQKVGELSNRFPPGTLLLNAALVLPAPVEFIVLGFRPLQYVERVEGGYGGNICNSPEDVVAAGGTLDYREHEKTEKAWFQTLATAVILIKKPDSVPADTDLFTIEFNGGHYALALWGMKGGSYTNAAKPIFTQRKIGSLRKSWSAHSWFLTTELEKYKTGNAAYIPSIKKGNAVPEISLDSLLSD